MAIMVLKIVKRAGTLKRHLRVHKNIVFMSTKSILIERMVLELRSVTYDSFILHTYLEPFLGNKKKYMLLLLLTLALSFRAKDSSEISPKTHGCSVPIW